MSALGVIALILAHDVLLIVGFILWMIYRNATWHLR